MKTFIIETFYHQPLPSIAMHENCLTTTPGQIPFTLVCIIEHLLTSCADRHSWQHPNCQICVHPLAGGEGETNDEGERHHPQGSSGRSIWSILCTTSMLAVLSKCIKFTVHACACGELCYLQMLCPWLSSSLRTWRSLPLHQVRWASGMSSVKFRLPVDQRAESSSAIFVADWLCSSDLGCVQTTHTCSMHAH